jgi:hypothetical protein
MAFISAASRSAARFERGLDDISPCENAHQASLIVNHW